LSKKQNAREGIKTWQSGAEIRPAFASKKQNAREGIKTDLGNVDDPVNLAGQKNKMPARALRRSTTLLPVEGAGGVKKTKCPRGH